MHVFDLALVGTADIGLLQMSIVKRVESLWQIKTVQKRKAINKNFDKFQQVALKKIICDELADLSVTDTDNSAAK